MKLEFSLRRKRVDALVDGGINTMTIASAPPIFTSPVAEATPAPEVELRTLSGRIKRVKFQVPFEEWSGFKMGLTEVVSPTPLGAREVAGSFANRLDPVIVFEQGQVTVRSDDRPTWDSSKENAVVVIERRKQRSGLVTSDGKPLTPEGRIQVAEENYDFLHVELTRSNQPQISPATAPVNNAEGGWFTMGPDDLNPFSKN